MIRFNIQIYKGSLSISLPRIFIRCIVLSCLVLYCVVFYCIVLYYIVLYCNVMYCIVLYCIVLYCIVLYCIVLYCLLFHFAVRYLSSYTFPPLLIPSFLWLMWSLLLFLIPLSSFSQNFIFSQPFSSLLFFFLFQLFHLLFPY